MISVRVPLVLALAAAPALAQGFDYFSFASVTGLTLNGDAAPSGTVVRVSNNGSAQTGSFFFSNPVRVTEGFDTNFDFRVTTSCSGLAFVVHDAPSGANALGGNLWGMGYGFGNNGAAIPNSLVIELDCVQNGFLTDLSAQELSVHTQGALGNSENEGASLGHVTTSINWKNGQVHNLRVVYQVGTLDIYLDSGANPVLSVPFSFETGGTVLAGGGTGGLGFTSNLGYVGFTSSTPSGASGQNAEVHSWSWNSFFQPDPCFVGSAGSTVGGPYDLLQISGSNGGFYRTVRLGIADPFSIDVGTVPGQSNRPFVLLAWPAIADASTVTINPWGVSCFPPVVPIDLGGALAPVSVPVPPGVRIEFPLTLQAVMATDAGNPSLLESTNAVAMEFSQAAPPVVTQVAPNSAVVGGTITITGQNFSPFVEVRLAGTPVPLLTQTNTQLTFAMPAGVACDTVLSVVHPDGATATRTFNPTPVINNTFNPTGSSAGGTNFIMIGTGFAAGTTVTIGGNPANVTSAGATVVVCQTPPGTPGPAQVVVTTPGGCTVNSLFTYQ